MTDKDWALGKEVASKINEVLQEYLMDNVDEREQVRALFEQLRVSGEFERLPEEHAKIRAYDSEILVKRLRAALQPIWEREGLSEMS